MTPIKGDNLIISLNGTALAAAKTCTINVKGGQLPIATPNSGQWDEYIPAKKGWSISTGQFLLPGGYTNIVTAYSAGFDGANQQYVTVTTLHGIFRANARGMYIVTSTNGTTFNSNVFDTYASENYESACNAIATIINNLDMSSYEIVAIVTCDAFAMNDALKLAIHAKFNVPVADIATGKNRDALAIIGGKNIMQSVIAYTPGILSHSVTYGGTATTTLFLDRNGSDVRTTPLKNSIAMINQKVRLSVRIDGLPFDVVEGYAICKEFKVTGSKGNILNGSFEFLGTGPLE